MVRQWYREFNRVETVLTLRSEEVIGAEVLTDRIRIDYIPGRGQTRT
jgi:deoxyinosine 3'endonuclease (endonuclease V)